MRKKTVFLVFLIVFLGLSFLNFNPVHATGISIIAGQYGKGSITFGFTISVTMNAVPTTGDVLIACCSWQANGATSVTSIVQVGVTWIGLSNPQAQEGWSGDNKWIVEIWYGIVGSTPSSSLIVTFSNGNGGWGGIVDVYEFAGLKTSYGLLDKNASNYVTSGHETDTGTTATTDKASQLWIGCTFTNAGAQDTPTNGFSLLDGSKTGSVSLAVLYKIVSSTGTANSGTNAYVDGQVMIGCIATFESGTTPINENGQIDFNVLVSDSRMITVFIHGEDIEGLNLQSQKTVGLSEYGKLPYNFVLFNGKSIVVSLFGEITENVGMKAKGLFETLYYVTFNGLASLSLNLDAQLKVKPPPAPPYGFLIDVDYYLFGQARYIGLILVIIALFVINFLNKWSFIITVTLAFLMFILYMRQTPPLIWEALLTILVGIILMLTGVFRLK